MGYLSIIFIFLLGVVDGFVLVYFLYYQQYAVGLIAVHFAIYLIIHGLARKTSEEYKGVPCYIALFMPGLGGIVISILYFSIAYFVKDSMVLEEYENYISYERIFKSRKTIDYSKEIRTLSFIDQMNLLEAQNKKQLIIDASISYYTNKIKILQKGLLDGDKEVQHYSAVTINVLENEFSFKINQLREKYNLYKDIDTLLELERAYSEYIDSRLISSEILQAFNGEYIDILNKIIKKQKPTQGILIALIKAYIRSSKLEKAEQTIYVLLDMYADWASALNFLIHIYHEKKDYAALRKLTSNLGGEVLDIQNEYKDMISFWKG